MLTMARVEHLDNSRLEKLKKIGGDQLVLRIIESFLEHAPKHIESAISGVQSGDYTSIEYAVHSLKSSAGNLGAITLQMLAEKIEQFAENKELAPIASLVKELEEVFGLLTTYLNEEKRRLE